MERTARSRKTGVWGVGDYALQARPWRLQMRIGAHPQRLFGTFSARRKYIAPYDLSENSFSTFQVD